jgi:hypothetical protein
VEGAVIFCFKILPANKTILVGIAEAQVDRSFPKMFMPNPADEAYH